MLVDACPPLRIGESDMNRSGVPEPRIEYAPKHYICKRAQEPLVLDGRVDKAFWDAAPWTDDFVDIEGDLRQARETDTGKNAVG